MLPLVCSRWRRLADAPPLVHSFRLHLAGPPSPARQAAFRRWVERSGPALRSLTIHTYYNDQVPEVQLGELLGVLAACSGLEELCFSTETRQALEVGSRLAAWAATMPRLRLLELDNSGAGVAVRRTAGDMAGLHELHLEGYPVRMVPAALLPPALTALHLGGGYEDTGSVPAQVCSSLQPACLLSGAQACWTAAGVLCHACHRLHARHRRSQRWRGWSACASPAFPARRKGLMC